MTQQRGNDLKAAANLAYPVYELDRLAFRILCSAIVTTSFVAL